MVVNSSGQKKREDVRGLYRCVRFDSYTGSFLKYNLSTYQHANRINIELTYKVKSPNPKYPLSLISHQILIIISTPICPRSALKSFIWIEHLSKTYFYILLTKHIILAASLRKAVGKFGERVKSAKRPFPVPQRVYLYPWYHSMYQQFLIGTYLQYIEYYWGQDFVPI